MKTLTLIAVREKGISDCIKRIKCLRGNDEICTVWADGVLTVHPTYDLLKPELRQVVAVARNFQLFYHNIKKERNETGRRTPTNTQ